VAAGGWVGALAEGAMAVSSATMVAAAAVICGLVAPPGAGVEPVIGRTQAALSSKRDKARVRIIFTRTSE
jgi:hypothetical protein